MPSKTIEDVKAFPPKDIARFWSKVRSNGDDCWEWLASFTKAGYGQIMLGGSMWYSHRAMYALTHGTLPDLIDHACRNRGCCNPQHLRASDHYRNNTNKEEHLYEFVGVEYDKRKGSYSGSLMLEGVRYRRSNFPTAEEARDWLRFVRWHLQPDNEANNRIVSGVEVPPLDELFPKPKRGRRLHTPTKSERTEL